MGASGEQALPSGWHCRNAFLLLYVEMYMHVQECYDELYRCYSCDDLQNHALPPFYIRKESDFA